MDFSHDEEILQPLLLWKNPAKAVRAAIFGDVHWSDDYVRFNGCGNLEQKITNPATMMKQTCHCEWIDKTDI